MLATHSPPPWRGNDYGQKRCPRTRARLATTGDRSGDTACSKEFILCLPPKTRTRTNGMLPKRWVISMFLTTAVLWILPKNLRYSGKRMLKDRSPGAAMLLREMEALDSSLASVF